MRPLIGMASVDKRRPPKCRALRPAGRRSLPFGHSPERLILPKNRQTNHSRHKAYRPLRAAASTGIPPPARPPGKDVAAGEGFPPTRASVFGEISPQQRCRPDEGALGERFATAAPMQVPARREFRHGEDAGPLQRGFRPNENAALTLFREALSSSAPAGKTLPIALPRFSKTLSRLVDDSALDKERISANRVGLFLRKRCAAHTFAADYPPY